MGKHHYKFNEEFLLKQGFTRRPDGSWGKESSPHHHPPGRSDAQPDQGQPEHRENPPSETAPTPLTVAIVTVRTVRPRDYDGLGAASKHYLDGLRLCGLFEDDDPSHLEVLAVSELVDAFSKEETIIELFQVPKEKIQ